jgi:hypothetical protein
MSRNEDFYRERADAAGREADAATLANVRERALRAQQAWLDFAEREHRADIEREKTRAEKVARDEARAAED